MKVNFLSPVNAGSKQHQVGDTADLPNAQARELIACGAAEQFDPAAAKAEAEAQAIAAVEAEVKAKAEQKAADLAAKKAQG